MIINEYIEKVFNEKKLKKLFIVTHLHKQHFQGLYKYDIGNLIEDSLKNSHHKENIIFINFAKTDILNLDDYEVNDIASHLIHTSQKKYISYILDVVNKETN